MRVGVSSLYVCRDRAPPDVSSLPGAAPLRVARKAAG
jgi:hypothetical protein